MRQLTIHIPEKTFAITEEQKVLIDNEFRKLDENPDYALDWDEVQNQLKFIN